MTNSRTQLIRDPVHGLIVFDGKSKLDQLALRLINTPEFQRLRRIKQLGVSEFVYPGAVHTRFSHCIGTFHVARKLVEIIKREMNREGKNGFDENKANIVVIAALLHDLGHGPFSHTFEGVQEHRGAKKRHEHWTREIIQCATGEIWPVLLDFRSEFADAVADIFTTEEPRDIYHAIVSSSFDADRLDYLRRDRLMTGIGAGAIDFDWLLEHVRIGQVRLNEPDAIEDDDIRVETFCLDMKALPAAEQFLLSRYTMHEQVYFHKTTRCAEKMIAKLLTAISDEAKTSKSFSKQTGLPANHPLGVFFSNNGETVENYLQLDDATVMGSLSLMRSGQNKIIANFAARIQERKLYKTLDVARLSGDDQGAMVSKCRTIDKRFSEKISSGDVIKDEKAKISIYTKIGGDDERIHKKLHILVAGVDREISDISDLVKSLATPKTFTRYYFADEVDRNAVKATHSRRSL